MRFIKRNELLLLIIIAICYSCCNNNNKIKGKWIEADNFQGYVTLDIGDFTYRFRHDNWSGERLYHIVEDTIYNNGINRINKSIFKVEGGKLSFYELDSLNPVITYERNTYKDLVDYFNSKKNTSIQLPHLDIKKDNYENSYENTLYADYKNDKLEFYVNGTTHEINDTSYFSLSNFHNTKSQLIIDEELPVELLNQIKTELRKAQMNSIAYTVYNQKDTISHIGFLLPAIELPGLPLPPIMPERFDNTKIENIVIEIYSDSLLVNASKVNNNIFREEVKRLIKEKKYGVVRLYYDESLRYKTYINYLYKIQKAYYELRNELASEKYNIDSYLDLDRDEMNEVRNTYPMKIHEIDKIELNELLDKHLY